MPYQFPAFRGGVRGGGRYLAFVTIELALVLGLLLAAVIMFAMDRPRMDVVAILMMTALPFTGVLTVGETLAGFADLNVILIAMLFVMGEGLVRTGVAQRLGDLLVSRTGQSETRLIVLLMVLVVTIGSVMSSTGVVAIFIPIVLRIAHRTGTAAGRLMMPLSVAALISGMMTLVGTPPNLVVHAQLVREGEEGFKFFSMTPFGIPIALLAIGYMLIARRWIRTKDADGNPAQRERLGIAKWIEDYSLAGRAYRLRVAPGSPLVGRSLVSSKLRSTNGVNVVAIERPTRLGSRLIRPTPTVELQLGDVLVVDINKQRAEPVNIDELCETQGLISAGLTDDYHTDMSQEIGMAEMMIPDNSPLIDKTVLSTAFRSKYDLTVLGLKRGRKAETTDILETQLEVGDTLLVIGPWRAIKNVQSASAAVGASDLIVLNLPAEFYRVVPASARAPFAIASLLLVVVLMVTGVVPNVQAAMIGCLLMGLFGCISMASAYRSIHWQSLVLIVGMLPFSLALQKTGAVDMAAEALIGTIGNASPHIVLGGIFLVTMVLGLFISNTATAVLMAPVALAVARELGAAPHPFAMTVALAASTAFMTPVSSPVNTLVVGPGNYTFFDFVRIGVPLAILTMVVTVFLVPWLLPLYGS